MIEQKDAQINFSFQSTLQFDICWRHSYHYRYNFFMPSSYGIIPLIVRENQSRFVVLLLSENRNNSQDNGKYSILNLKTTKKIYNMAKSEKSYFELTGSESDTSTQTKFRTNWNEKERKAVEETLYIYLKHSKKLI